MTATRWRSGLQFALWAAVGAGGVLGVLTAPTIGLFVLPVAVAVAAVLAWRRQVRLAGPGVLTGLGLLPCYIAYLNRGGPGTICTTTATSGSCTQEWSPWPWLAVGLCLVVAGLALQARTLRRQARQHDEVHRTD
jgi:hypothetical protein